MTTVRFAPGFTCPTDNTATVTCDSACRGGKVLPSMLVDAIAPGANVTEQYGAPLTLTCIWTLASAAVPRIANTSRTERAVSTTMAGATHCSTARNPSTWMEYCPPDRVRRPLSWL